MKEIFKQIKLSDGNELRLLISDAYCGRSIRVEKDYIENENVIYGYTFCMWDDCAFDVFVGDFDFTKQAIILKVDANDPLFFCFHRLLEGIQELIIDSDEYDYGVKVLIIRKTNNNEIELEFRSNYHENILEKYSVFIKNVGFDLRSKIDCDGLDTKERLYKFFEDIIKTLLEEYHQISIDEYILTRTLKKLNK